MDIQFIVMFMLALMISAVLHEIMHGFIALKLGDDLAHSQGRLSLNPVVHIDPVLTLALPAFLLFIGASPILAAKPVPVDTMRLQGGELGWAAVSIAGPLTNLALAFVGGAVYQIGNFSGVLLDFTGVFILVNVSLFVFNMLPIPPLDGSRIVYAFAPRSVREVMRQIEAFGIFGLIVILMVAGPAINPIIITMRDFILNLVV